MTPSLLHEGGLWRQATSGGLPAGAAAAWVWRMGYCPHRLPVPAFPPVMPRLDLGEPLTPLQIFFGLRGRIPRHIFWLYGVAAPIALGAYANAVLNIANAPNLLKGVVNAVLLWTELAVSAKRWHDRDKSGWWALLQFVPVIGTLWTLVENGLLRGTPGPNRFGEDVTDGF
jgi:uncharacterized membrane protein YhaH (DUF805 family)